MKRMKIGVVALITVAGLLVVLSPDSYADSITLNINIGSTLPSLPAPGYGTLTLTLGTGSNGIPSGSIKADVELAPNFAIQTGQDASVAFNSSLSPDPTISITSALPTGYALENGGVPTATHMDGFGYFEYGISSAYNASGCNATLTPACTNGAVSSLIFTISTSGGFTSVNNLMENSAGGIASPWAFDIFSTISTDSNGGRTGIVGTSQCVDCTTTSIVPEPTTLLLLGTGITALWLKTRRKSK